MTALVIGGPKKKFAMLVLACSVPLLLLLRAATNRRTVTQTGTSFVALSQRMTVSAVTSPSCKPRHHLVFLKTHKCASSTVQNILLRYGDSRKLNFVLPPSGHYLGTVISFRKFMVAGTPWHRLGYDIFTHHTVFNKEEIKAIMPPDTIYISILRDPVSLFESLFSFDRFDLVYKMSIEEFAKWNKKPSGKKGTRASGHLGRNQMLFDLGFNASNFDDDDQVHGYIKELENTFDLMMIAERFDESLILLKHLLCWTTDDVVYFRHNARRSDHKHALSLGSQAELRRYNRADQMLYDHFSAVFDEKVRAFGAKKMRAEIAELRHRIQVWHNACGVKEANASDLRGSSRTWSDQVIGFRLPDDRNRNSTCSNLIKSELPYTREVRMKQLYRSLSKVVRRTSNKTLLSQVLQTAGAQEAVNVLQPSSTNLSLSSSNSFNTVKENIKIAK